MYNINPLNIMLLQLQINVHVLVKQVDILASVVRDHKYQNVSSKISTKYCKCECRYISSGGTHDRRCNH